MVLNSSELCLCVCVCDIGASGVNSDSSEEEITEANDTSMAEHQVNALISIELDIL